MQTSLFKRLLEIVSDKEGHCCVFSEALIDENMKDFKHYITSLPLKEAARILISLQNYMKRSKWIIHEQRAVKPGDICYVDFGHAYLNEAGFQHFALVLSQFNGKLFVIPMTSNPYAYAQAYCEHDNPDGKIHLMRFGKQCGLERA